MKKNVKRLIYLALAITLASASIPVLAEEVQFNASMSKQSYTPGENLTLNYQINNPTNETKTYKCMLTYDPPTSKTPGCIMKAVTVGPGQNFTGSILSEAEFAVETGAEVKLIDENDNVIAVQNIPIIRVREAARIVCGDDSCDAGENYQNCPKDCHSGGKDDYCDGVTDAVCDPDCNRTQDPDCVCNHDGACETGIENFKNCPSDCPSGSKDGYCDGITDGRCDPDCAKGEDPDCNKTDVLSYLPYIGVGVLLIAVIVFLGYKKGEARKIEKEKEEFEKWKQERGGQ